MANSWNNSIVLRLGKFLGLGLMSAIATLAVAAPGQGEIISVGLDGLEVAPLSEADQARLEALLEVQQPEVLSTLSPDGTTLVVAVSSRLYPDDRSLHFLNILTGELSDALALEYDLFAPDLPLRWIDNDTLRYVQRDVYGPWEIITVNRETQIASRTRVYPTQPEDGEVLGIAPDFSKFAVRVYGEAEDIVYIVFLPSLRRLEVARLPKDLEIKPPAWSTSGDQVALVTSAGEERQLYDRTPYSPSLATAVIQDALGRLAVADNPFHQHSAVRVFDFSQAEPLRLELTAPDQGGDTFGGASLSPDGRQLLVKRYRPSVVVGRDQPSYVFPESAYYQVYDLAGTVLDTIAADALRGPMESQGQFLGRDRLLFWAAEGINRHLYVYDLGDRTLTPLPLPSGSVDADSIVASETGRTIVYGFSSVMQPPELFAIDLNGEVEVRSLTALNASVSDSNRVRMDVVSFTTSQGDRPGWLVQPAGSAFPPQGVPIVLWQQGGPGFSMANEFATDVEMPLNLLPNFGLAVLVVPLSGREGFGPELYRALADGQNFGQVDVEEGADIIEQMIRQGWTTAAQVGVTGCSYGGYYAAHIMAQFPQLVGAANPQCSLLDTLTEWQLGYSSLLSYLVGQTPMEAPARYLQASPLYSAQAIRTPTLLFHGAEDFLQIDVARNFHDVIDLANVPVTLYEFEGVGHSLYGSGYQPLAAQLQIEFFRQYLRP
ncbi:alpha/beta hydrolase family protein [Nodosilinea sp. E11]|uniref:alpha/beta hydrolase family protein n=1 Tax=Nodosilinea sp. E11 TaxID=3037479 RepID=UPI002934DA4E|nr:prolyl oligopeptidase family serine peptidase [Nodosilinea sp. E11]WOD41660.1 prolyl oligopeptidase family serine peptidase [Nodosilinea sp. E11]